MSLVMANVSLVFTGIVSSTAIQMDLTNYCILFIRNLPIKLIVVPSNGNGLGLLGTLNCPISLCGLGCHINGVKVRE